MPATADDLLGQIESYHLMSAEDIAAVRARWFLPDRPEAHDATRFCEWLRASHALTDFTLNALARGRADRLTLHKYRLIDRLRAGPEAGDYLAADPLDRRVHIQIIAPALAHDPARFGRFRQVVQRAMNVLHPNVPRVLDLGHTPDVDFLVSEHIDGESLEEVLKKRGKLPPDLAVRIFVMAFDALEALHRGQLWAGELTAGCLVLTVGDKGGHGGRSVRLANFAFPKRFFDSSALNVTGQPAAAAPPPADDLLPEGPAEPEDDIARLGAAFYRCVTGWEPAPRPRPRAFRNWPRTCRSSWPTSSTTWSIPIPAAGPPPRPPSSVRCGRSSRPTRRPSPRPRPRSVGRPACRPPPATAA